LGKANLTSFANNGLVNFHCAVKSSKNFPAAE
jgi:hypothetical protein